MGRKKERKKAIFMFEVRNGCFLENTASMFVVANNESYSIRIV